MLLLATTWGRAATVSPRDTAAGFTLLEVILALGIATGILLVALVLYHQSAELRNQILQESDRLSGIRLALDKIAGDLRASQPVAGPGNEFMGDATSMRFTKLALAVPMTGLGEPVALEKTDWARIFLTTAIETNGTQTLVSALNRREEAVGPRADRGESNLISGLLDSAVSRTNQAYETLSDFVRFVRFRYWDGSSWLGGWSNVVPPAGVEVVLATDPLSPEAAPEALPDEPFRRVIYIPAGNVQRRGATNGEEGLSGR